MAKYNRVQYYSEIVSEEFDLRTGQAPGQAAGPGIQSLQSLHSAETNPRQASAIVRQN